LQFTCLLQELQYALSVIAPTVGTETSGHPGIRIKCHKKKNRVKLMSTEGAHSTEIWIDATVKKPFDTVIEGDRFIGYISKLDVKEVTVKLDDERVTVESSRGKPKFGILEPEKFPDLPKIEEELRIDLAGKVFKRLVLGVAFATKPERRGAEAPLLEGINIVSDGKRLKFMSMNGYIIAHCKKSIEAKEMNMTVAKKSLVNAAKTVRDDDKVTIQSDRNTRLIVKHNDITYYIPVYSGSYPAIKMPKKDFMTSFTLDKHELLGVLERGTSILEDAGQAKGILQVEKGKVILEGRTQKTDFHEAIPTDVKGKKTNVKIDIRRMTDVVKAIDADQITIGINEQQPIAIQPEGRSDQTCLLAVG